MSAVHRDEVVEELVVFLANLPRAEVAEVEAVFERRALRAGVRRLAFVFVGDAGGIHMDAIRVSTLAHELREDALGRWATADVSGADEEDADGFLERSHLLIL